MSKKKHGAETASTGVTFSLPTASFATNVTFSAPDPDREYCPHCNGTVDRDDEGIPLSVCCDGFFMTEQLRILYEMRNATVAAAKAQIEAAQKSKP